jgi:hypothetical protein
MNHLFEGKITTTGQIEDQTSFFIDLHYPGARVLGHLRYGVEEPAVQMAQLVVTPAGLLGLPDEPLAVTEEHHHWRVGLPGLLLLPHDQSGATRFRVGRHYFEYILVTVCTVEQQFGTIRCPADIVDVLFRVAAHIDSRRGPTFQIVDEDSCYRVFLAGLRVLLGIESRVDLGVALCQKEHIAVALVDLVVGQFPAVRRPPHRRTLVELLAIHPAGDPVPEELHSGGCGLDLLLCFIVHQDYIVVAVVRGPLPIGRWFIGQLLRTAGPPGSLRLFDLGKVLFGNLIDGEIRQVDTVVLFALHVIDCRAVLSPDYDSPPA